MFFNGDSSAFVFGTCATLGSLVTNCASMETKKMELSLVSVESPELLRFLVIGQCFTEEEQQRPEYKDYRSEFIRYKMNRLRHISATCPSNPANKLTVAPKAPPFEPTAPPFTQPSQSSHPTDDEVQVMPSPLKGTESPSQGTVWALQKLSQRAAKRKKVSQEKNPPANRRKRGVP